MLETLLLADGGVVVLDEYLLPEDGGRLAGLDELDEYLLPEDGGGLAGLDELDEYLLPEDGGGLAGFVELDEYFIPLDAVVLAGLDELLLLPPPLLDEYLLPAEDMFRLPSKTAAAATSANHFLMLRFSCKVKGLGDYSPRESPCKLELDTIL